MPALSVCSTPRCPTLVDRGRCDTCTAKAEALRGNARQRGYNTPGHQRFRSAVLTRDPICVCTDPAHGHGRTGCMAAATVADHYPRSRRELTDAALNPNDPKYGRGLCKPCHDRDTAQHQPGGWNTP